MLGLIDRISEKLGAAAAMTFFLIGLMITFEVVARYVFTAPTTWAEEGARLLQLWATYLAMGFVLKNQALIRITALTDRSSLKTQRYLDVVALVWIIVFSLYAFWLGVEIVAESIEVGRATATMNQVPKFWTESAIPIGFFVLILQALAEIWRLLRGPPPADRRRERDQQFNEFGS